MVKQALGVVLLAMSAGSFWAVWASPNVSNARETGLKTLIDRIREVPLEGVILVLLLALGIGQAVTGVRLLRGLAGRAELVVAGVLVALFVLGALGFAMASAGSAGSGGSH